MSKKKKEYFFTKYSRKKFYLLMFLSTFFSIYFILSLIISYGSSCQGLGCIGVGIFLIILFFGGVIALTVLNIIFASIYESRKKDKNYLFVVIYFIILALFVLTIFFAPFLFPNLDPSSFKSFLLFQ